MSIHIPLNTTLLQKVRDRIRVRPEVFDASVTFQGPRGTVGYTTGLSGLPRGWAKDARSCIAAELRSGSTKAGIAGLCVALSDDEEFDAALAQMPEGDEHEPLDILQLAGHLIGVPDDYSNERLFNIVLWPTELWTMHMNARNAPERAKPAVIAIDHFINVLTDEKERHKLASDYREKELEERKAKAAGSESSGSTTP